MSEVIKRVPPHNPDAELALLSTVFTFPEKLGEICETLRPEHFYKQIHQLIFQSFMDLDQAGQEIDSITVNDKLQHSRVYRDVGAEAYLNRINETIPSDTNFHSYVSIILENSRRRKIIGIADHMLASAWDCEDVDELLHSSESDIFSVAEIKAEKMARPSKIFVDESMEVISNKFYKKEGAGAPTPTGFKDFDELTQGFHSGDMIVFGARPSMGKTALSLQFAKNIAIDQKYPVVLYSLEMAGHQLVTRLFSNVAKIDGMKLRSGKLSSNDITKLAKASAEIASSPLFINDYSNLTILDIRNDLRRIQRQLAEQNTHLRLVIIDYLQLIHSTRRHNNEQERISELSRSMKALAREFKVPVFCLSQLSRKIEERADKKPMLSDLRESGAIEQDADLVLFLHRQDYYKLEDAQEGKSELIIAKHRNGPLGTVHMFFDKSNASFHNFERGSE